jgi:hypothetical protein
MDHLGTAVMAALMTRRSEPIKALADKISEADQLTVEQQRQLLRIFADVIDQVARHGAQLREAAELVDGAAQVAKQAASFEERLRAWVVRVGG